MLRYFAITALVRGTPGQGETVGFATRDLIWSTRFCPLIVYTAVPYEWDWSPDVHPFVSVEQKGVGSEERVLQRVIDCEMHVSALADVEREIRSNLNAAVRDVARRIFQNASGEVEGRDMLMRSARRRVAARMDDALSFGGPSLKSWEFYLCPPICEDLLSSAPGFLDSGLTVFASTLPRPARRGHVAPERDFDSGISPASTARCTFA